MASTEQPSLLALDWGTTACRAFLFGAEGVVLAERRGACGLTAVTKAAAETGASLEVAFEQAFEELCREFLFDNPGLPVIACGMVGSSQGWADAGYRQIPAEVAPLGVTPTQVRSRAGTVINILPGLKKISTLPDVMRGEETQILGAISHDITRGAQNHDDERIVLLPGTHSKWVRLSGTIITDFTTCMTGEIFGLLTTGSILSGLATPASSPCWDAFDHGLAVAASHAGRGGILNTAFSARTLVLAGELAPDAVGDYLSGLVIGEELNGIARVWLGNQTTEILLCGDLDLTDRYARALERRGLSVTRALGDTAAAGMWQVALSTGLVPSSAILAASHLAQCTSTASQTKG